MYIFAPLAQHFSFTILISSFPLPGLFRTCWDLINKGRKNSLARREKAQGGEWGRRSGLSLQWGTNKVEMDPKGPVPLRFIGALKSAGSLNLDLFLLLLFMEEIDSSANGNTGANNIRRLFGLFKSDLSATAKQGRSQALFPGTPTALDG